LLKLRQVCCDPRLVKGPQATDEVPSAKLQLLTEMLVELVDEGRRVLVFSQFTEMLGLIERALVELKLPHLVLTGQTPPAQRGEIVRRFQAREQPVLLVSLKAGGVGLNLTAADTVIHVDPWWNPAVERQATDRAHRIGQDQPVFVYQLVVQGSIEERMLALQSRKAALAEGVLGVDAAQAPKFSEDDLRGLLAPLP
jgi:SNF2 family DNA or RNA helicase